MTLTRHPIEDCLTERKITLNLLTGFLALNNGRSILNKLNTALRFKHYGDNIRNRYAKDFFQGLRKASPIP